MKIIKNTVVKSTKHNKPIVTDVYYKDNKQSKPMVIFCHGFKGYKDWGAWNKMTATFVKNNFFFVKFNFSHNGGTLENPIDFPDLEAFGNNNYTTELNDLQDVINWVTTNPLFSSEIEKSNITLIGHSRGGGIATIKASEDKRITNVISWNGVSDYEKRFPNKEELNTWKENRVAYIENGRTKQQMPLYYQFYEDFNKNKEKLNIKKAVKKLKASHLIIQGTKDNVVLPLEAENLHKWNKKSELFWIKEMNHAMGCTQPWQQPTMPLFLEKAVQKSIQFIKDNR